MAEKPSRGLADVVAASTGLSDIDGRAGRLFYRGYDINELAGVATFEETAYLLQRGSPPTRGELAGYRGEIAAGRALVQDDLGDRQRLRLHRDGGCDGNAESDCGPNCQWRCGLCFGFERKPRDVASANYRLC